MIINTTGYKGCKFWSISSGESQYKWVIDFSELNHFKDKLWYTAFYNLEKS